MGQKTNPNLLRLSINTNEWKSKHIHKTSEESSLLVYQNIEIKTYLNQFLSENGLIFHDYKLYINNDSLYLYVSYFTSLKSIFILNKNSANQKIKLKKEVKQYQKIKKKSIKSLGFKNIHKQRNLLLKSYKSYIITNKYRTLAEIYKNNLAEEILETMTLFTNSKYNIYITFQNLNSNKIFDVNQKIWRKKLLLLKKYQKNKFFKEAINILLISVKIKNSSQLLAEFVAKQLATLARQSYFLIFLKRTFLIFLNTSESKISGIKLLINGRFNGKPRARNQIITVGNIPTQKLSTNINYHQSTAFSSNGTFGVKVWIALK